ncbi:hypothetical protein EGI22_08300 [Lacihabitans sp. LS3-19]|uniref:SLOG domain-containing protein n=1 Tax=Lacihabitans sp. LS3-19 TaxID=2487335 RepID=UPI0020CEE619|nr:hypothetical protein [Lacihabitans sp. LS3-19]MCP9767911.1 hypothetical protein [Lacihabitans sp. LS3-19]
MATNELKNIFLSASIPLQERNPKYYGSADVIAIRDAVIALTTAVLPYHRIVWGGHPSITPLINYVMQKISLNIQEHVTIYQSRLFEKHFPEDNNKFENVILTPNIANDREMSLNVMRNEMLSSCSFSAGIFIGGMEGVEDEFEIFNAKFPNAVIIPLASTGAASKIIYDRLDEKNEAFLTDYAYMSVFQKYLLDKI